MDYIINRNKYRIDYNFKRIKNMRPIKNLKIWINYKILRYWPTIQIKLKPQGWRIHQNSWIVVKTTTVMINSGDIQPYLHRPWITDIWIFPIHIRYKRKIAIEDNQNFIVIHNFAIF